MNLLKIIQCNIRGFYNNLNELKVLTEEIKPDVLCLQETHLLASTKTNYRNFKIIRKDNINCINASGGVMMCIKNTYHCSKIDIDTNLQAVAAQITIDNENKVTICSIYLKPYELVDNDTLNLLI